MSRRSRAWESKHEEQADISTADNKGLQDAGKIYTHATIESLRDLLGGGKDANRKIAERMLEYKGKEATSRSISSQMKSIQRWLANEQGSSSQRAKPKGPNQAILNRILTDEKLKGEKKTQVKVKGPSSVNGYKRDNRDAEIYLDPMESRDLFDALAEKDMDAAWDILAHAYGVNEFHAYSGAAIEIY